MLMVKKTIAFAIGAPSISAFCFSRATLAAEDSLETPAAACCTHVLYQDTNMMSYLKILRGWLDVS
jgi:hypothetical protein